jgi:hypothetical protein
MTAPQVTYATLEAHFGHELRVTLAGVTEGRRSRMVRAGVECVTCRVYSTEWPGMYKPCMLLEVPRPGPVPAWARRVQQRRRKPRASKKSTITPTKGVK